MKFLFFTIKLFQGYINRGVADALLSRRVYCQVVQFLRIINAIIHSAITSFTDIHARSGLKERYTFYITRNRSPMHRAIYNLCYNLPLSRECLSQTPDGPSRSSRIALWRFSRRARDENSSKFPLHSRSGLRWSTKFEYCAEAFIEHRYNQGKRHKILGES